MDWIQQWQSKLNKQNGVAPLVRTGGSRHTGLAALPHRNIHRGMKMGIQKGMKQERENTLKLVAKMSQNGDTEYIARLMEPEVFEQMAAKYGMKA